MIGGQVAEAPSRGRDLEASAVVDRAWLRALAAYASRPVPIAVLGWTAALYVLTFVVVRRHYGLFLPHYDSIGAFAHLFDIVNEVQAGRLASVVASGVFSGTTWLQPAYAVALSWAPIKAPEWLVSLNFVLLLVAQAAIVTYGRTVGYSRLRQFALALLPVVPGSLFTWDGGFQDLRRDGQLVILGMAILFLSLAYVARPSWQRGLALGLVVGLAQWSRDNAAAVIAIVGLPALALAAASARAQGGLPALARLAALPLAAFLAVAAPYYAFSLPATLQRYAMTVWGVGEGRVESLLAFWDMPYSTLFGGDFRFSGRFRTAIATAGLLGGALLGLWWLGRQGILRFRPAALRERGARWLIMSGLWVIVAVLLYNTLLLGYGARWHAVPFIPMTIGQVAVLAGLLGAVGRADGARQRDLRLAVAAGTAALLVSAPLRMVLNEQKPLGADGVAAVRDASLEIARIADGRTVAFLSVDRLSRHHAHFYLAQAGLPPIRDFESASGAHGDFIDFEQPIRVNDDPAELRRRLDRTLRNWADFVLIVEDPSRYGDAREVLWPYLLGQPVVAGLLADPAWQPVARFELVERPHVLLKNNGARPAGAGRAEAPVAARSPTDARRHLEDGR